jgi:hypothetical protein
MSDNKDTNSKQSADKADARVNRGRHEAQCSICRHPHRQEIEEAWVGWGNTGHIAKEFDITRDSIYRHAHATGLFAKRQANFKMIHEKILERVDWIQIEGSGFTSILKEYVKIISAEKESQDARPSDPKALQPDETQQLEVPTPDGSLANLVGEAESPSSKEPHGNRDSVNLIGAQTADAKPVSREMAVKGRDNGAHVGPLTKLLDEMVGAEPGKSQDGNVEAQSPQTPTLQ